MALTVNQTLSASLRQVSDTATLARIGPPQRVLRDLVFCGETHLLYSYDTSAASPGDQDVAPMDGGGLWRALKAEHPAADDVSYTDPGTGPASGTTNVQDAVDALNTEAESVAGDVSDLQVDVAALLSRGGAAFPVADTLTEGGQFATTPTLLALADTAAGQVYDIEATVRLDSLSGGSFSAALFIGDAPTLLARLLTWTPGSLASPAYVNLRAKLTVVDDEGSVIIAGESSGLDATPAGAPDASCMPMIGEFALDFTEGGDALITAGVQLDALETCSATLVSMTWRRVQ